MNSIYILCSICLYTIKRTQALPPEACFAPFNQGDCGKAPTPVMYYWKSGSRCEVGYWRGCLPNINMFVDEYECISTCIFSARAMPEDYHSLNEIQLSDGSNEEYGDHGNQTVTNGTMSGNDTDVSGNSTEHDSSGGNGTEKADDDASGNGTEAGEASQANEASEASEGSEATTVSEETRR